MQRFHHQLKDLVILPFRTQKVHAIMGFTIRYQEIIICVKRSWREERDRILVFNEGKRLGKEFWCFLSTNCVEKGDDRKTALTNLTPKFVWTV